MKKEKKWTRWHRYDNDGVKHIKRFEVNEVPTPLVEEGYSEWKPGCGPLSDEHYKNVANAVRAHTLGKPKSEEQKEKMRQAKLGVPKSDAHRQAMANAWVKRRQERYQQAYQVLRQQNG